MDRIDIVYICSNAGIARANLPKLQIGGASERSFALATRLTMLATELAPADDGPGFMDNKLNFVSFTPGTSFEMGHSGGQRRERELLFHLLAPHVERRTPLMNLLQGWVTKKEGWRRGLGTELPIEPRIRRDFDEEFEKRDDLQLKLHELFDTWFRRYRRRWPDEARWGRDDLIGQLRRLLAAVCIRAPRAGPGHSGRIPAVQTVDRDPGRTPEPGCGACAIPVPDQSARRPARSNTASLGDSLQALYDRRRDRAGGPLRGLLGHDTVPILRSRNPVWRT